MYLLLNISPVNSITTTLTAGHRPLNVITAILTALHRPLVIDTRINCVNSIDKSVDEQSPVLWSIISYIYVSR